MKKPSGSAAAKQASSTRPGFQPSAAAQFTAIEISSGRIVRMSRPFMAGDRTDGLMKPILPRVSRTGKQENAMARRCRSEYFLRSKKLSKRNRRNAHDWRKAKTLRLGARR